MIKQRDTEKHDLTMKKPTSLSVGLFWKKKQKKYFKAPTFFQIFKLTQTDSNSQQVTTVTSDRTTGTKNKMRERRDKKS